MAAWPMDGLQPLRLHRADMLVVKKPFVVVIASQLLFTAGDLLARLKMRQHGFDADAFMSWWFATYMVVRTLATFGQLWVLSKLVLGQTLAMFAAASVVLSIAAQRDRPQRRTHHKDGRWRQPRRRLPGGLDATVMTPHSDVPRSSLVA
jgi:hypothetical protein